MLAGAAQASVARVRTLIGEIKTGSDKGSRGY
jgi:hypothetical protein